MSLVLVSLMALAYNLVGLHFTRIAGSITMAVVNIVKLVLIINLAAILLDHTSDPVTWLGMAIFCVGLCLYAWCSAQDHAERRRKGEEQKVKDDGSAPGQSPSEQTTQEISSVWPRWLLQLCGMASPDTAPLPRTGV